ncbi:MAG: TPM domain-containing protein [Myxococcales bacterium]
MRHGTPDDDQRRPGRIAGERALALVSTAVLLFCATVAWAAAALVPPAPTRWATDTAQFISEATRAELDTRLQAHETASGQQVLLWIGRTTGDASIEEWAARTYASWRVGRKGLDDGVVLFLMADDRKVRIEVGYGLEDRLTDARAATIIREQIVPRLRQGDPDGAARAGIDSILGVLGVLGVLGSPQGETGGQPAADQRRQVLGLGQLIVIGILGLLILGFAITHPRLAILLLTTMGSGRGGFGGGGGGGGGFSGGGGGSGGGGASGSW